MSMRLTKVEKQYLLKVLQERIEQSELYIKTSEKSFNNPNLPMYNEDQHGKISRRYNKEIDNCNAIKKKIFSDDEERKRLKRLK